MCVKALRQLLRWHESIPSSNTSTNAHIIRSVYTKLNSTQWYISACKIITVQYRKIRHSRSNVCINRILRFANSVCVVHTDADVHRAPCKLLRDPTRAIYINEVWHPQAKYMERWYQQFNDRDLLPIVMWCLATKIKHYQLVHVQRTYTCTCT